MQEKPRNTDWDNFPLISREENFNGQFSCSWGIFYHLFSICALNEEKSTWTRIMRKKPRKERNEAGERHSINIFRVQVISARGFVDWLDLCTRKISINLLSSSDVCPCRTLQSWLWGQGAGTMWSRQADNASFVVDSPAKKVSTKWSSSNSEVEVMSVRCDRIIRPS